MGLTRDLEKLPRSSNDTRRASIPVEKLLRFFNGVLKQESVSIDEIATFVDFVNDKSEISLQFDGLVENLKNTGIDVVERASIRDHKYRRRGYEKGDFELPREDAFKLTQNFAQSREIKRNTNSVQSYMREIKKVPLLTREREAELAKQYEAGLSMQLEALAFFPGVVDYILDTYEEARRTSRLDDLLLSCVTPFDVTKTPDLADTRITAENAGDQNQELLTRDTQESLIRELILVYRKFRSVLSKEQNWQTPTSIEALTRVASVFKHLKFTSKHHDHICLLFEQSSEILRNQRHQLEKLASRAGIPIKVLQKKFNGNAASSLWLEQQLRGQPYSDELKTVAAEMRGILRFIDEELLDQRHSRQEVDLINGVDEKTIEGNTHSPGLTYEFICAINRDVRQGAETKNRARNDLVLANQRLVISIARKFPYPSLDFLDLVGEGNLGLLKAIERFDYRLGFKLATYATWWIHQWIDGRTTDSESIRSSRIGQCRFDPEIETRYLAFQRRSDCA